MVSASVNGEDGNGNGGEDGNGNGEEEDNGNTQSNRGTETKRKKPGILLNVTSVAPFLCVLPLPPSTPLAPCAQGRRQRPDALDLDGHGIAGFEKLGRLPTG